MALNVQSIEWAEDLLRPRLGLQVRVPSAAVVFVGDVIAIGVPALIARSLGWHAATLIGAIFCILALHGHYRRRISLNLAKELSAIAGCVGVATLLAVALPIGGAAGGDAELIVRTGLVALALIVLMRAVSYSSIRALRAHGVREPTLIVGAGAVGVELANTLLEHPEYGLAPVGFLDNFDDGDLPVPMLGTIRSLDVVLREYDVRRVIIAFGSMRENDMVPVIRACDRASVDIHVLPRFFELGATAEGREADDIWGMPVVRLPRPTLKPTSWRIKRAFDFCVGGVLLVLSAPLFALLAMLVRLSSPGPVLFRQKRVGQYGRVVEVLKFRSLRVNDDSDTHGTSTRTSGDPVGALPAPDVSLDELPQLWNVFKGDMSLVGPRPERPFFVHRFTTDMRRLRRPPPGAGGLTGWAQIHGLRGDTSIARAGAVRQPVHRALVAVAGHRDPVADRSRHLQRRRQLPRAFPSRAPNRAAPCVFAARSTAIRGSNGPQTADSAQELDLEAGRAEAATTSSRCSGSRVSSVSSTSTSSTPRASRRGGARPQHVEAQLGDGGGERGERARVVGEHDAEHAGSGRRPRGRAR